MSEELIELRRQRLKSWFMGKFYPKKEASLISRVISGKATIGENLARRLETVCGMPNGYLDGVNEADKVIERISKILKVLPKDSTEAKEKLERILIQIAVSGFAHADLSLDTFLEKNDHTKGKRASPQRTTLPKLMPHAAA